MTPGVPCAWCGFMETSHLKVNHHNFSIHTPCVYYQAITHEEMRQINTHRKTRKLSWSVALPPLRTIRIVAISSSPDRL